MPAISRSLRTVKGNLARNSIKMPLARTDEPSVAAGGSVQDSFRSGTVLDFFFAIDTEVVATADMVNTEHAIHHLDEANQDVIAASRRCGREAARRHPTNRS